MSNKQKNLLVFFIVILVIIAAYFRIYEYPKKYELFENTFSHHKVNRQIIYKNDTKIRFDKSKIMFSLDSGNKNALIIKEESRMVFKIDQEKEVKPNSEDLILVEFSPDDSLITPRNNTVKNLYRKLIGLEKFTRIDSNEIYELKKIRKNVYHIYFDLYDFKYDSIIDFNSSKNISEEFKR